MPHATGHRFSSPILLDLSLAITATRGGTSVRERDRRTITIIGVVATLVLATILVVVGSQWFAVAIVAVAFVGLVAFLRVTHPRGAQKPNLYIFFDDLDQPVEGEEGDTLDAGPGAADGAGFAAAAPVASGAGTGAGEAEVIDLRQPSRREPPAPVGDDAVAAGDHAPQTADDGKGTPAYPEVAEELSAHHVRLLRQVETKLRDYQ
jgi:hypothetical protein